jgi:predicted RNase H-like HicB family nuclease
MDRNRIRLTEIIFKEGPMYVAFNPELDVSSCGKSRQESKKNLVEALTLFIEEATRKGTLGDILLERGFIAKGGAEGGWTPPRLVSTDSVEIPLSAGA